MATYKPPIENSPVFNSLLFTEAQVATTSNSNPPPNTTTYILKSTTGNQTNITLEPQQHIIDSQTNLVTGLWFCNASIPVTAYVDPEWFDPMNPTNLTLTLQQQSEEGVTILIASFLTIPVGGLLAQYSLNLSGYFVNTSFTNTYNLVVQCFSLNFDPITYPTTNNLILIEYPNYGVIQYASVGSSN